MKMIYMRKFAAMLKLSRRENVQMEMVRARILVQATIYRRFRIGRDSHLDQSGAYDIS